MLARFRPSNSCPAMKTTAKISFTLSIFLYFLSPATCTFFSGTFFNDYNANGIRDTSSPGYYEDGAVSIPVRLKSCNDATKDEVVAMTYTNEEGQYYFNISANESGNYLNDDSGEICYYLYVDVGQYSVSPYVTSGVVTQMTTNQVYPDSGRSDEEMPQLGDEVVWNVGIMGKSSSVVQESIDAVPETTSTPATTTEMVFISTQSTDYPDSSSTPATTTNAFLSSTQSTDYTLSTDYPESFFSSTGTNDTVMDMIDNLGNHTMLDDIADDQASVTVNSDDQLTTSTTIATERTAPADNVTIDPTEAMLASNGDEFFSPNGSNYNVTDIVDNETTTTLDSLDQIDTVTRATESSGNVDQLMGNQTESIFNGDNVASEAPSSISPVPMPTKRPTSSFWTNGQSPTSVTNPSSTDSTSFSESSSTAAFGTSTTSGSSTFSDDEEANAEENHSPQDSDDDNDISGKEIISSLPSVSPTDLGQGSTENAALPNATDTSVVTTNESTDTNTTKSTNDTQSTTNHSPVTPTPNPSFCLSCALHVQAIVRIELDNIESKLNDDSRSLFEGACASFLEDQLSIATPPISDVGCVVVNESLEAQSQGRSLRGDYNRSLSQLYLADVNVTGTALSSKLYQTPESIRFKELCVGTFTVQGKYFVKALHETEQNSGGNNAVFQSVQNARGVMTYDASQASQAGEQIDDPSNPNAGRLSSGVLVAITASSVFCVMGFFMYIVIRTLDSRRNKYTNMDDNSEIANVGTSMKLAKAQNDNLLTLAPTNSNASGDTAITPVSIRSNADQVEVNIIPQSFSGRNEGNGGQSSRSAMLNTRVRRNLMAPPGKLGILVADTPGCGPAVHTIREGSPMEGLIFVNDIIIAINGINTRNFTATQITQCMKETIQQERAITVLSSVR